MEEENKDQQPFEQNGENLEENKSSAENSSVENIANGKDLFGFDDKKQNNEVVVIYEQPESSFKDTKNNDKKIALIFSLIGLLFSVFFSGAIFSIVGFILSICKIKHDKKSSLLKWALIISICGMIIYGCLTVASSVL